jgi:hypothetical protein
MRRAQPTELRPSFDDQHAPAGGRKPFRHCEAEQSATSDDKVVLRDYEQTLHPNPPLAMVFGCR